MKAIIIRVISILLSFSFIFHSRSIQSDYRICLSCEKWSFWHDINNIKKKQPCLNNGAIKLLKTFLYIATFWLSKSFEYHPLSPLLDLDSWKLFHYANYTLLEYREFQIIKIIKTIIETFRKLVELFKFYNIYDKSKQKLRKNELKKRKDIYIYIFHRLEFHSKSFIRNLKILPNSSSTSRFVAIAN